MFKICFSGSSLPSRATNTLEILLARKHNLVSQNRLASSRSHHWLIHIYFLACFSSNNYIFIIFISFFWWSIKFPQQNINHSSETGNITSSVTTSIGYFRKKTYNWRRVDWGHAISKQNLEIPGAKERTLNGWSRKNNVEFPWALDVGLGISKGCNRSFRNSRGKATFCLEFLAVK